MAEVSSVGWRFLILSSLLGCERMSNDTSDLSSVADLSSSELEIWLSVSWGWGVASCCYLSGHQLGVAFYCHPLGCKAWRVSPKISRREKLLGGPRESLCWSTVCTNFSHRPRVLFIHIIPDVCRTASDVLKASVICRATCGADWSLSFYFYLSHLWRGLEFVLLLLG